jgi:spore maturation protein SpmA
MKKPDTQEIKIAQQARRVGLVLIGTMAVWLGLQYFGGKEGWDPKYILLIDLAALAGFIWALVVTYQIWRNSRA